MAKLLFLAIAVWLLVVIVKRYRNSMDQPTQRAANQDPENMVQCASCGVHLPKSDSLLVDQRHYCSVAHSKVDVDDASDPQ